MTNQIDKLIDELPGGWNGLELKILPKYFQEVLSGSKTFEIRYDGDKDFYQGQIILLREFVKTPQGGFYTEQSQLIQITYITKYEQKENYVVFAFKLLPLPTEDTIMMTREELRDFADKVREVG